MKKVYQCFGLLIVFGLVACATPVTPTPSLPAPSFPSPTLTPLPAAPTATPPSQPPASPTPLTHPLWIDHQAVAGFEQIPEAALATATQIRFLLRHASIGENISRGLDCLWGNYPERRPNHCGEFYDLKYDRSRWVFQPRGNPGWIDKVNDFITETEAQVAHFDVFSFAFDYADGLDDSTYPPISDPENFQARFVDKVEALEAVHPDKVFVWWTMSLARQSFDNQQQFNQLVREYAQTHNKILFDIADIETHSPEGVKLTDAAGREVLYADYTDEEVAGHLNTAGRERLAKALWYLMARLGGWPGQS